MSRRTERVASLIRLIIAEAIRDHLSDPRIPAITSITRVEVSGDLSVARVYVSVLASDSSRGRCLDALRGAAGLLRRMMAPELHLRKLPVLEFRLDDSLQRGFETVTAIDQAMRELGEGPEWERGRTDTGGASGPDSDDDAGGTGTVPRRLPSEPQEDA